MRERDLNLNLKDEKELNRIKTILFPKRMKDSSHLEDVATPKSQADNGVCMRTEIEKLRGEISTLLAKGKGSDFMAINTERAYLDGINRLSKQLKNNANEISEVFDQFLAHLPTKLTNQLHQYNSHYYFSMLVQNVAWNKMAEVMRKPLLEAFVAIKEESEEKRLFQERVCFVQNERKERIRTRLCANMGKYFNIWRFNNKCIEVKLESQEYLRENNLQNDQRLTHSLLNLPLLVLMLEQLGRQSSDISQLLVLDSAREKACKYIEQGQSIINSSIETVTQRSLLQSERSNMKFSRFDITLSSSLTKQCIESGEILFINNLSKNHDYSQIDNLSYWQSLGKSNTQCLKGGAIFYPIFDVQQNCIGVLRQYFYEGVLTAISNKKLEKICTFLELGLKMEQRTRVVAKEKEYQREGYYMKMIGLVKKMEMNEGNEKESMSLLSEQLKTRLGVTRMAIYKVQKKENSEPKDLLLKKIWGESQDCKFLITLVHQLLKQQSNYIYLQNRLVVYANQTLFDLQLQENLYANNNSSQQGHQNVLPIDLIVNVLSKVQTILASKAKESRQMVIKEQIEKEKLVNKERKQLMQQFQQQNLRFLSNQKGMPFLEQIKQYIYKVYLMINGLSVSEKIQYYVPQFYLQCFIGNFRKDRCLIKLGETDVEIRQEERPQLNQLLKVQLTDKMNLYCDITLPNEGKQYMQLIGQAITDYYKSSIKSNFIPSSNEQTYNEIINSFTKNQKDISAFPSRQQKKDWETNTMTSIFSCFTEAIQRFIFSCFGCQASITWEKQAPSANNIESWKQSIYKICLSDQQCTSMSIMNKNAMISYTQYCQLKLITNFKFSCIEETSHLVISNNKSIYRSRNAVQQNNITVSLPLYFHSDDEDNSECQLVVRRKLEQLKAIFARMCQSFISGVNTFNERFQFASAKAINTQVEKYQTLLKKHAFSRIKVVSNSKSRVERLAQLAVIHLYTFQKKLLWHAFKITRSFSQSRYEMKREETYGNERISVFLNKVTRILYSSFGRLKQHNDYHQKVSKLIKSTQSFVENAEREVKRHYFLQLNKISRKQTNIGLFNQIIHAILLKRLFSSFYLVKDIKQPKPVSAISFEQLQKCQSLSQIKENIAIFTPEYTLFLQINEDQCFTLYSPNQQLYLVFQSIETAYMPSDPLLSYQCGSEGQFIWNYSINNSENCFQVKDRLNSISKCIELGVKNCRKTMELNLLKCSMFHRNWKRQLKSKFFKQWGAESKQLQMSQRNRLNDSLYQVSIQTQTIKQKLKTQEKILRNNHNQYRQLIKKQEEYKHEIIASTDKIASIEQHQAKLQSAKTIYHSLHRRTMIKTIFVQWRKNSSAITLLLQQKRLKTALTFKKIAFNTIKLFFNSKKSAYWKDFAHAISIIKKEQSLPKFKGVEKIDVLFEQHSTNRLVTFQSELQEQENSNQNSNRSDLDDSQISYNKRKFQRDRSPLQKVQLSAEQYVRHNNGAYKLNPKTLKFLKRMGKLES